MTNFDKAIPFIKYENEQHKTIIAAWYAGSLFEELAEKILAPHGVSLMECRILHILKSLSPEAIPVYTIRHYMPVSGDISRAITSMHNRGLVKKLPGTGDKRVVPVVITPYGVEIMEEFAKRYRDELVMLPIASDEEAAQTTKVLEKIISALQQGLTKYNRP